MICRKIQIHVKKQAHTNCLLAGEHFIIYGSFHFISDTLEQMHRFPPSFFFIEKLADCQNDLHF